MDFSKFKTTIKKPKGRLIALTGLVSLFLIFISVTDYLSNRCDLSKNENIIYNSYVVSTQMGQFVSLWTLQFFKDDVLVLDSPHGSLGQTASVTASMLQDSQNRFAESINNSSCGIWGYLKMILLVIALLAQAWAVVIALDSREIA